LNSSGHIKRDYTNNNVLPFKEECVLRRWLLTGSFSKKFDQTKNYFTPEDTANVHKLVNTNPNKTKELILLSKKYGINKHSPICALSFLSSGGFRSKKIFAELFPIVIENLEQLYEFMFITKKRRGFGSVITNSIKKWIASKSYNTLQTEILTYPKYYGWSFKDVLNVIKPRPRSEVENKIFQYCLHEYAGDNLAIFKCYEELKENKDIIPNITKAHLTNRTAPGNMEHGDEAWSMFFKNMNAYDMVKNIDKLVEHNVFNSENIDLFNKKINESSLSPFYLAKKVSDGVHNEKIEKILTNFVSNNKDELFNIGKKVCNLIDIDLIYCRTMDEMNAYFTALIYSHLISSNVVYTKKFFKDKFDFVNIDNIDFVKDDINIGNMISYRTVSLKYLKNDVETLDPEIIIIWTNNKKIETDEETKKYLMNKTVISISFGEENHIDLYGDKSYVIRNFSYKTPKLIKIIAEGKI